jgi:hypothetical protein
LSRGLFLRPHGEWVNEYEREENGHNQPSGRKFVLVHRAEHHLTITS